MTKNNIITTKFQQGMNFAQCLKQIVAIFEQPNFIELKHENIMSISVLQSQSFTNGQLDYCSKFHTRSKQTTN